MKEIIRELNKKIGVILRKTLGLGLICINLEVTTPVWFYIWSSIIIGRRR